MQVYTWGMIAHGRLGLGRPKVKKDKSFLNARVSRKKVHYQTRPCRVHGLDSVGIIDISAGQEHALVVSSNGEVYAWGKNTHGQCGIVPTNPSVSVAEAYDRWESRILGLSTSIPSSVWDDVWAPRMVPPFGAKSVNAYNTISSKEYQPIFASSVTAGGYQSAVIDSNGSLWTWGGGGNSACLGHGNSTVRTGVKMTDPRKSQERLLLSGCMSPPKWSEPRVIEPLRGMNIAKVSLGETHSAAISIDGEVYVWGSGACSVRKVRID